MARLIHVGNSLGLRIPKAVITQLGFKEDMDLMLKVTDKGLLIAPSHQSREGWTELFQMAPKEKPLMGEKVVNQFDEDEWVW